MCRNEVADPVAPVVQGVVNIEDRPARIAEYRVGTLLDERFDQDLSACHSHSKFLPKSK
jgi:hypothetical protein